MIKMLISRTQTTTLYEIKAHTNIGGNDQAYTLAKQGRELDHRDVLRTDTLFTPASSGD